MIELGNVHTESVVESTIHLFINGIVLTRYVDLFEKTVDNNNYSSNQYYFNLFVDPTKTSSTTSSTTSIISTNTTSITTTNESTTTITTIVTKCNYISLITEQSLIEQRFGHPCNMYCSHCRQSTVN
ncbi:unnamed protein product [Rotaria sordida]|uniref:Uncharacterized protein n=1 Tax=Rotaria sordida TaxID=392033 RepID=A0A813U7K5_9BILA|nr:unnamed protein product [Rotaria sordida]CAF0819490.1 unnamed protein product [Rotaria sordida]